jgi:hypothetical protein
VDTEDPNSGTNLTERTPEAKLKGHVEYLLNSVNNLGGRCSVFANGTQCTTYEQFWSAIQNEPQALDTIRETLKCGRSPSAPVHPLILDMSKLHQEGETCYQKILDEANKGNPYYFGSANCNGGLPIPKPNDGVKYWFTGKIDGMSNVRPLGIELKGEPHAATHTPDGGLNNSHLDVLQQSVEKAHALASVHGLVANVGIFAITFNKQWLVWMSRRWEADVLLETLEVLSVSPESISILWDELNVLALNSPASIYTDPTDAAAILRFLHSVHPRAVGYCRVVPVGKSHSTVYAVTFPQLFTQRDVRYLGVSSHIKHIAVKVVETAESFNRETECLRKIWTYLTAESIFEAANFYALGATSSTETESWSLDWINFKTSFGTAANLIIKSSQSTQPWWWQSLLPSDMNIRGCIIMRCGEYKQPLAYRNREVKKRAADCCAWWMRIIHQAGVIHRDIRMRNVVEFRSWFRPYSVNGDYKYVLPQGEDMTQSCYEWQLIDLGLGCSADNKDAIIINTKSGQYYGAGVSVRNKGTGRREFSYRWGVHDDFEMLLTLQQQLLTSKWE